MGRFSVVCVAKSEPIGYCTGWWDESTLAPRVATAYSPVRLLRHRKVRMTSYSPVPLSLPPPNEDLRGIEFVDLLRILWRRRAVLAVVFALSIGLGLAAIRSLEATYTAHAALVLEVAGGKAVNVDPVAGGLNKDSALIRSEMDVLSSYNLAAEVVDHLGLTADPEFNPFLHPREPTIWERMGLWESEQMADVPDERVRHVVVNSVLSRLSVENEKDSYTVRLYFEAEDPDVAAEVASAFAELYVVDRLQRKHETIEQAAAWVGPKLDELRGQVTAADKAVQTFRERHQMVDLDDSTLIDQQMKGLSAELAVAAAERMRHESVLEEVRRIGGGAPFPGPGIVESSLIRELRSEQNLLRAKVAEFRVSFGPRHTALLETQGRLEEVERRLEEEWARVRAEVEASAKAARAYEQALGAQFAELKEQRETIDRATIELRQLVSEADAKRSLFEAFVQGYGRTSAEVGGYESDVRILSLANPPLGPSSPPTTLLALLTVAVASMLALVAAAVSELMDKGYRSPADFERAEGIPVVSMIPLVRLHGTSQQHPSLEVVERPGSQFTEAIQAVGVGLGYGTHKGASQVILVTSATPDEGKTSLAIALGRFAACSGRRALLIDCDLRRPTMARDLGQPNTPGLVELSDGSASIEQVLHFDKASGMAFLPASGAVSYPGDICSSAFLEALIRKAKTEFDMIVLDSPPVGIISDALVLSRMADAVVLTVRWGKTPRVAVANALKRLATVGAPVAAAVFSHVDLKRYGSYNYDPSYHSGPYFTDLEDRAET